MTHPEYILTLSCLDQRGIVHRVSGFLAEHGCNIIDSAQFGDAESKLFFTVFSQAAWSGPKLVGFASSAVQHV